MLYVYILDVSPIAFTQYLTVKVIKGDKWVTQKWETYRQCVCSRCDSLTYLPAEGWYDVVCNAQLQWHFQHSCSTDPGAPRLLWWLRTPGWWPSIHWKLWRRWWHPARPDRWEKPESANLTFGGVEICIVFWQIQKRRNKIASGSQITLWTCVSLWWFTDKISCLHL